MIPKIIHYCWLGGAPKPESVCNCIDSWKKNCPDYHFKEWNENNINLNDCPQYVIDAYDKKKWAFATDYIRLKVVYEHGGIYFDTDVELLKRIDNLLKHDAFFGFEDGKHIATGLGFGAVKHLELLKEMMDEYNSIPFVLSDGSLNQETCPIINTKTLLQHGLMQNNKKQILDNNVLILPTIYMCPLNYETGIMKQSKKTISIHWFNATWMSKEDQEYRERYRSRIKSEKAEYWRRLPNRIAMTVLGQDNYKWLKNRVKSRKNE